MELGHCEREVPLRDAERPLDLLVWSVVDMAFRTGADRHLDLPGSYALASTDTSAETDAKASKDFRKSVAGVISDKYAAHGLPGFANSRRRTPQHRLRGVLRG